MNHINRMAQSCIPIIQDQADQKAAFAGIYKYLYEGYPAVWL